MIEVATPNAVIEALCAVNARRIGIDGIDGCGKTTLAGTIAAKFQCRVFSLDDYLEREKGGFLEFIDYQQLHDDVSAEEKYVIEGVCLLHVLQRAALGIDTLLYIKRRHLGLWAAERELDISQPIEDFLENERKLTAMVNGGVSADLGLAEEIIRYHYATRPHNKAHIVYFHDEPQQ